jgi:pyruvate dehydrogenase E2 component (dihydrolipoamide acetyltransferase)
MLEFKLPDVGEGIHEAEVLRWLVNVGDKVERDQALLEIQTDKAVVEIPAPVAGIIAEIRAEAGSMARVGDVLIVIDPTDQVTAGAGAGKTAEPAQATPSPTNGQTAASSQGSAGAAAGPGRRILAAPAVRKLALELEIDLARVPGSGPAGRVLPDDVKKFAAQQERSEAAAPPAEDRVVTETPGRPEVAPTAAVPPTVPRGQELTEEEPLQGLRRRIAERMEIAWRIPHVTSFDEVDAANLVALRKQLQPEAERRGLRLTYLPFIVKAVTQTLKENPYLNASLDMANKTIRLHRHFHIGIATTVPEGLLVPVIRHADQLNLLQIAGELTRLGDLAQQRKLELNELSGSTFTITNFGSFGGQQGTPIINPPEVAILGVGRLEDKPVVVAGQVEVRPVLPLALSYDHRLIDGAAAGQFLKRLIALLADPNLLFLELV